MISNLTSLAVRFSERWRHTPAAPVDQARSMRGRRPKISGMTGATHVPRLSGGSAVHRRNRH
jgi:hypothetical protein